jgi:hypothetical protein
VHLHRRGGHDHRAAVRVGTAADAIRLQRRQQRGRHAGSVRGDIGRRLRAYDYAPTAIYFVGSDDLAGRCNRYHAGAGTSLGSGTTVSPLTGRPMEPPPWYDVPSYRADDYGYR